VEIGGTINLFNRTWEDSQERLKGNRGTWLKGHVLYS